jgi:hypothetical protein
MVQNHGQKLLDLKGQEGSEGANMKPPRGGCIHILLEAFCFSTNLQPVNSKAKIRYPDIPGYNLKTYERRKQWQIA